MSVKRVLAVAGILAFGAGLLLVLADRPLAVVPAPAATVAAVTTSPSPSAAVITAIPDGYRVQIPRLAIDLPITEGDLERDTTRQETPENFAFHLPGTAIPGDGSNTYLYAHARRGMFLSLWNARIGDEVWISTPDGRALRYVVSEVHPRVEPSDVSWAARSTAERLTLQTSTGPNPTDPRFVVVALPA
ncbi:MAG TPA: sortase [Candidatus Limnocylindria bacterium]|nr:sortase [Candidatus Limnocylindria bacterium]